MPEPVTAPDKVIVWLPVKKADACCPSSKSASKPEPEPSLEIPQILLPTALPLCVTTPDKLYEPAVFP